jgi:hypothetical protein
MPVQKGSTLKLLLGYESTFKTAATDGYQLPVNTFGLKGSRALTTAATLIGTRNPPMPFAGNKSVAGPVVVPVDSLALPYWLRAMFGASTVTGAGPYVHEWKIGDTMPSLTLEGAFLDLATDKYTRFLGCKVAGFSLEVGGDGELVMPLNLVGADHSFQAAAFDVTPTAVSLARVNNFQAALTEGGSALNNAKLISLAVEFGLDTSQYVIGGGGVLGAIPEGSVKVTGRLQTLFEDTTLLDKAAALTETGLKLTITGGSNSIVEFEMQEVFYEWASPEVPGPQGLMVDLPFSAFYDNGAEASAIVARVTNGVAAYP